MKPPVPFDDDVDHKPSPEQAWEWECTAELERMKLWRQVYVASIDNTAPRHAADQAVANFDEQFMKAD